MLLRRLLASSAFLLLVAGCESEQMIAPDELERGVSKALDDSNQKHDSVSCPEGVTAQVAESATCTMTVGPVRYSVTVLVRSVEGDQATYDVEVAPQPLS